MANTYCKSASFIPVKAELKDKSITIIKRVEQVIARIETADTLGVKPYDLPDDLSDEQIDLSLGQANCEVEWLAGEDEEGTGVYISHAENFNAFHAEKYVRALVEGLELDEPVVIMWSLSCDRLKVDHFTGGAFVIIRKRMTYWPDLEDLIRTFIEENKQRKSHVDYIHPDAAVMIRVYDAGPEWNIDAVDATGKYTEECWTHWGDQPLTEELATQHARDFAIEIGRPDLIDSIQVVG